MQRVPMHLNLMLRHLRERHPPSAPTSTIGSAAPPTTSAAALEPRLSRSPSPSASAADCGPARICTNRPRCQSFRVNLIGSSS